MNSRKSLLIRIDPRLHEELVAWAQQEFRSVNGQIEFLLREAVARRRGRTAPAAEQEDPLNETEERGN
jgi:hypothetical protein